MKIKKAIILALTVILSVSVSAQEANSKKKAALEEASAKLVELSTYITTMTRDLVEKSAADPSFSQSEEFANLQTRISDLKETQNTTFALIETLNEIPEDNIAAIDSILENINVVVEIGEAISDGLTLDEAIANNDDATSLTELVETSETILTESVGEVEVDQDGEGLSQMPNIYKDPTQSPINQALQDNLQEDLRDSTTTPGVDINDEDATQI